MISSLSPLQSLPPFVVNKRASQLREALDIKELKEYKEGVLQDLKHVNSNYPIDDDVYAFFNKLLQKTDYYYSGKGDDILVILDDDYRTKLDANQIGIENFHKAIMDNIDIINTKYRTIQDIYEAYLSLLKLNNQSHKEKLDKRDKLYTDIINNPESLPDFAKFFNVSDDRTETKLLVQPRNQDSKSKMEAIKGSFTLDFNTIFQKDTIFSPYIHMLTEHFEKIKKYSNMSIGQMIKDNIWKIPPLNTPRDYLLSTSDKYSFDTYQDVISFEYQLMKKLFEQNIIKHNFNEEQINFILGSYRNCVFGNNRSIDMYVHNSKYFDTAPFFKDDFDCTNNPDQLFNNLCKQKELMWNIQNNQIGIENAAHRRLIFPYVVIEDNIVSRLDEKSANFEKRIGILIFRRNGKYFYYYISIIKGIYYGGFKISIYDIHRNTVYLVDSVYGFPRNQLLESKYAIEALLKNLLRNKFEPFNKKKCDIIVFSLNKKINGEQLYLLSLYNKEEIIEMYNSLLAMFISYNDIYLFIQEYIRKIKDDFTELVEYRYVNVDETDIRKPYIFIWNIHPSEINVRYRVSSSIRHAPCIKIAEYSNIFFRNLEKINFYKGIEEMNLAIRLKQPVTMLIDLVKYNGDSEYSQFIDTQIAKITEDAEHARTRREREDPNTFYNKVSDIFKEELTEEAIRAKQTGKLSNYKNIFTGEEFYSEDKKYNQFIIRLGKPVKYYIDLLLYTQNLEYKKQIDDVMIALNNSGYNYITDDSTHEHTVRNKYIKYINKYLNLYNKVYNNIQQ